VASENLIKTGASIILADTTDHNPTAGVTLSGTRTDQIDLTSLAAGAYRQSAKFDFTTPRGARFRVRIACEWNVAPTAGGLVNVFIGESDSSTAANSNVGNLSGSDAVYNGYGAAAADADEAILQLDQVGSMPVSNDADTQVATIGIIVATLQRGIIVVQNDTDQAFISDAVEMSVHIIEVIDESQ